MSSKLELNIRNLIAHCEELLKDDSNQWMLKKYVKSLDTMIQELESSTANEQINRKLIDEYHSRSGKIKKSINYIEPQSLKESSKDNKQQNDDGIIGDTILREIKQIHNNKYTSDIRQELLGGTTTHSSLLMMGNSKSGLRKRDIQNVTESSASASSSLLSAASAGATTGPGNKDGLGQAVKHYTDMQEKIAEDMLILTRNLKEQTETANRIIRKDTELVTASTKLSDRNYLSLSSEADKLQEHSKRAWKCWMWIMIALVMTIFIFMVLFMKIMKKKVIPS